MGKASEDIGRIWQPEIVIGVVIQDHIEFQNVKLVVENQPKDGSDSNFFFFR